jgi:hypothetical protein
LITQEEYDTGAQPDLAFNGTDGSKVQGFSITYEEYDTGAQQNLAFDGTDESKAEGCSITHGKRDTGAQNQNLAFDSTDDSKVEGVFDNPKRSRHNGMYGMRLSIARRKEEERDMVSITERNVGSRQRSR